jgi:hypothetical protein
MAVPTIPADEPKCTMSILIQNHQWRRMARSTQFLLVSRESECRNSVARLIG